MIFVFLLSFQTLSTAAMAPDAEQDTASNGDEDLISRPRELPPTEQEEAESSNNGELEETITNTSTVNFMGVCRPIELEWSDSNEDGSDVDEDNDDDDDNDECYRRNSDRQNKWMSKEQQKEMASTKTSLCSEWSASTGDIAVSFSLAERRMNEQAQKEVDLVFSNLKRLGIKNSSDLIEYVFSERSHIALCPVIL